MDGLWLGCITVVELVVALVDGWNGGEREGEKSCRNEAVGAGFFPTLDPIFSSFRTSNPPLFIGGERGQSLLHKEKI